MKEITQSWKMPSELSLYSDDIYFLCTCSSVEFTVVADSEELYQYIFRWHKLSCVTSSSVEFTVVSDGEFKAALQWCDVVIVSVDFLWCASVYSLHLWFPVFLFKRERVHYHPPSVSCGVLGVLNIRALCSHTADRFEENICDFSDWYFDLNKGLYIMLKNLPFCLKQRIK